MTPERAREMIHKLGDELTETQSEKLGVRFHQESYRSGRDLVFCLVNDEPIVDATVGDNGCRFVHTHHPGLEYLRVTASTWTNLYYNVYALSAAMTKE